MRIIRSSLSTITAVMLAVAPLTVAAENAKSVGETWAEQTVTADTIVKKHVAALGGEKLLRSGKSFTFTVSGEKMGKQFTKTVVMARPNKMRVDITGDDGTMSKGFDGKVAWIKKGDEPAIALNAEDTRAMKSHAQFDEPLLDYAKKGTKVRLIGRTDVKGVPAFDLEVTFKSGDVEHHFLDANSYLLLRRTFTGKDKDGKAKEMSVRFGDYKPVQGRMVNHSVEWDGDDGKSYRSAVSKVAFDQKVNAKLFRKQK